MTNYCMALWQIFYKHHTFMRCVAHNLRYLEVLHCGIEGRYDISLFLLCVRYFGINVYIELDLPYKPVAPGTDTQNVHKWFPFHYSIPDKTLCPSRWATLDQFATLGKSGTRSRCIRSEIQSSDYRGC